MRYIIDFHSHSRYSRACSKNLTIPNISRACELKGIDIIGTADFTHPKWIRECEENLKEVSEGLFGLKDGSSKTKFMLATEVACIYKQGGATRRLHLVLLAPSFQAVHKLIKVLEAQGRNLHSDGRPILGLSGKELLSILLEIDPRFEMIPAHAWTPWFAVFGSKSGFDSLEECFEELTPHIHAIETGLSSDPIMNWQLSALDNITLVSNSDAHSPDNFGREANVMDLENPSYDDILNVIRKKDREKFLYTIEFYPEEGKYHADGHRDCDVMLAPEETAKLKGECPKCKKPLTVGVRNRVNELADRAHGFEPENKIPFKHIVPLRETISAVVGVGKKSKKVAGIYDRLVGVIGNEFEILLDLPIERIEQATNKHIAEAVKRVREGNVFVSPGYDGVYGTVSVTKPGETMGVKQLSLV
ncbi:MAG: DNA helicase UvrD [Parcubacteria group bacterium]|nr:DNA helicase UvrD [Parcubacteria group bacterium]